MELKHLFDGSPSLWISRSKVGYWYIYRQISKPSLRARMRINEAYAKSLIEQNDRSKAERALEQALI